MAEKTIPFNQLAKAGYNRPINRRHVNEIKRDFHEDMVQLAIVSFRDGKYWIIDHQHQTQAIYELNGSNPNTPIRCKVLTGLTYEQEADLYYRLNTGTKQLGFFDKVVGRVESGDPVAIDFRDTVEACGYVLGGKTSCSLRAVNVAWSLFCSDGGKERLTRILSITHASWPDKGNSAHSNILRGIDVFLDAHGDEYKDDRLVLALSKTSPKEIIDNATAFYKKANSKLYTKPYCIYMEIVSAYNSGLRNKLVLVLPDQMKA